MALDSFQLLARQSESTEGELQVKVLQTLFDLIVLHGVNFGEERGFGVRLHAKHPCFVSARSDSSTVYSPTLSSASSAALSIRRTRWRQRPSSSGLQSCCFPAWSTTRRCVFGRLPCRAHARCSHLLTRAPLDRSSVDSSCSTLRARRPTTPNCANACRTFSQFIATRTRKTSDASRVYVRAYERAAGSRYADSSKLDRSWSRRSTSFDRFTTT
jgi:hypothetical protein